MVEVFSKEICTCLELFSKLLRYPDGSVSSFTQKLGELLPLISPSSAQEFEGFSKFIQCASREQIEEIFTTTFDLQPLCFPYIGYHLFGESYKRGQFMAGLRNEYRQVGFSDGNELPDHISVVLGFLIRARDDALLEELTRLCLVPSLESMLKAFAPSENPYRFLLSSLLQFLRTVDAHLITSALQEGGSRDA